MKQTNKLKTMTILFRAANIIENVAKEDVKNYACNLTEFGVLEVLHQKGQMTIAEIRSKVLIANSSMTYVLDKLQQKQYIERIQNPLDKRNYTIRLTNLGFKYTHEVLNKHYEHMQKVFDVLTDDENKQLQDLLKKIGYHAENL